MTTKSSVIETAAIAVSRFYPNQSQLRIRQEILAATFRYLCRNLAENQPEASAKTIFNYVKNTLALRAN